MNAEGGLRELVWAASQGDVERLKSLPIASWALLADEEGQTALHKAVANGHADCLRLLLPHIDAHMRDVSGMTALM
ncbi:hypothetical protein AX768_02220 [Burkholderia sp. PAMC 28687]|nr:hypothetical protein AX768_02220 [Burkholderia sp. PAMC 28687]